MTHPADAGGFERQPNFDAPSNEPPTSTSQLLFDAAYELVGKSNLADVTGPVEPPRRASSGDTTPELFHQSFDSTALGTTLSNILKGRGFPFPAQLKDHRESVDGLISAIAGGDTDAFMQSMFEITDKDPSALHSVGMLLNSLLKDTGFEAHTSYSKLGTSSLEIKTPWNDFLRYKVGETGRETAVKNPDFIEDIQIALEAKLMPDIGKLTKAKLQDRLDDFNAPELRKAYFSPVNYLPTAVAIDAIVDGDMQKLQGVLQNVAPSHIHLMASQLKHVFEGTDIEISSLRDEVSGTAGMIQLGLKDVHAKLSFRTDKGDAVHPNMLHQTGAEKYMKHLSATVKHQVNAVPKRSNVIPFNQNATPNVIY